VKEAEDKLKKSRLTYEIIGDGDKVIKQTPTAGDILTYPLSKILLYTDHTDDERVTVPNVIGMNLPDAIRNLLDAGLNVRISGNGAIAPSAYDRVLTQSISEGTVVTRGEIITIRAIKEDYED
jgi:beta-lactam-binding protein with PASTA domain